MKKIIFVFLFILTFHIYAEDTYFNQAITGYKDTYCILGSAEELMKINFSVKYNITYPYKIGFHLAYTQTMFWDLYALSSPFDEINFNPEAFWILQSGDNFLDDAKFLLFDFIKLGYEHKSNGLSGELSRGLDRLFGELQFSLGDEFNLAINGKYFILFETLFPDIYETGSDNPDIQDYIGSFEAKACFTCNIPVLFFIPYKTTYSVGAGGGINGFDFAQGWQQVDIEFIEILVGLRPYIQVWYGYGESLIDYDEHRFSVRFGISLK